MTHPSNPLFNFTRVAADAAISSRPGSRIQRVILLGGTDATSIKFYDAASATGTQVFETVAPFTDTDASAADAVDHDFHELGGIPFPTTGIYADITGTGAVAYVWWS